MIGSFGWKTHLWKKKPIENVRCDGEIFQYKTLLNWIVFDVCKAFNLIWYLANSVWHKPGIFARKEEKMERKRKSKRREARSYIGRFGEEVYWCQHIRCVHANWRRLYTQFSNETFPFSRPKQTRWISLDERKPSHRFWRTHPHQKTTKCRCFFSCVVAKQIQNKNTNVTENASKIVLLLLSSSFFFSHFFCLLFDDDFACIWIGFFTAAFFFCFITPRPFTVSALHLRAYIKSLTQQKRTKRQRKKSREK